MVLDRKASPQLLIAPLASLAALARSLRSPHRGEFSMICHWFVNHRKGEPSQDTSKTLPKNLFFLKFFNVFVI